MSFGMIVTCFMCIAHRFACSRSPTRNVSPASCSALMTRPCIFKSFCLACISSFTSLWNGSLQMRSSVDDWNFLISFRAFMSCLLFLVSFFPSSSFLFFTFSTLPTLFAFSSLIFFQFYPCKGLLGLMSHFY